MDISRLLNKPDSPRTTEFDNSPEKSQEPANSTPTVLPPDSRFPALHVSPVVPSDQIPHTPFAPVGPCHPPVSQLLPNVTVHTPVYGISQDPQSSGAFMGGFPPQPPRQTNLFGPVTVVNVFDSVRDPRSSGPGVHPRLGLADVHIHIQNLLNHSDPTEATERHIKACRVFDEFIDSPLGKANQILVRHLAGLINGHAEYWEKRARGGAPGGQRSNIPTPSSSLSNRPSNPYFGQSITPLSSAQASVNRPPRGAHPLAPGYFDPQRPHVTLHAREPAGAPGRSNVSPALPSSAPSFETEASLQAGQLLAQLSREPAATSNTTEQPKNSDDSTSRKRKASQVDAPDPKQYKKFEIETPPRYVEKEIPPTCAAPVETAALDENASTLLRNLQSASTTERKTAFVKYQQALAQCIQRHLSEDNLRGAWKKVKEGETWLKQNGMRASEHDLIKAHGDLRIASLRANAAIERAREMAKEKGKDSPREDPAGNK